MVNTKNKKKVRKENVIRYRIVQLIVAVDIENQNSWVPIDITSKNNMWECVIFIIRIWSHVKIW